MDYPPNGLNQKTPQVISAENKFTLLLNSKNFLLKGFILPIGLQKMKTELHFTFDYFAK